MELQPERSKNRPDPTAKDLEEVLRGLGLKDDFATLSDGDRGFLQVAGSTEQGGLVEYRDPEGRLFRSRDEGVPLDKVLSMFVKYAARDSSWRSDLEWIDVTHELEGSEAPRGGESDESRKRQAMKAYFHAVTGDVNNPFGRNKGCTGLLLALLVVAAALAASILC